MEYIRRVVDDKLNKLEKAFNAINIIGPKGCGKTRQQKRGVKLLSNFRTKKKEMDIWLLRKRRQSYS